MDRLPPWESTLPLAQAAPRCGARTRRGTACQSPGMANGRCRLHGGASTGPRTAEGIERIRASRTKHGAYSAAMKRMRELVAELKALREIEAARPER